MSNFHKFQSAIEAQWEHMLRHCSDLFVVDANKDELWATYLGSFPEGSNPMFRERTEHDCQCCKQFVRRLGKVVAMNEEGELVSVWHTIVDDPAYQAVADGMAALLESKEIVEPFFHFEKKVGIRTSTGEAPDGTIERWNHFCCELPGTIVKDKTSIPTHLSKLRSTHGVFVRSCEELTPEAVDEVLALIEAGNLYRGAEHNATLQKFKHLQKTYLEAEGLERITHAWEAARMAGPAVAGIRNTAIGTLLIDLSEGRSLEGSVGRYEAVVAPANYKRPKALVTPAMIKRAQQAVKELDMVESLPRRHAQMTDITVNNVLWADRNAQQAMQGMDVFDEMLEEAAVNIRKLENVPEINLDKFLDQLPHWSKVEILLENRLQPNLMSLVAPVYPEAPNILKWDNNFTWVYNGEVADSMKQQVKAAGGKVDGVLRFSLRWNHTDKHDGNDLDAHCVEKTLGGRNRAHIYYGNKRPNGTKGNLDVDIITPTPGKAAVENITWAHNKDLKPGNYAFGVHMYSKRQANRGFDAEIEFMGEVFEYSYDRDFTGTVNICALSFDENLNPTFTHHIPTQINSREVWGVQSMQFHRVSAVLNSPNHWDGQSTGNKHLFLIMAGVEQPGDIRGFFNEQLTDELRDHRKVFEVLGTKVRVEESSNQLSGLGFSSTQRNHAYVRRTNGDGDVSIYRVNF